MQEESRRSCNDVLREANNLTMRCRLTVPAPQMALNDQ
jgi:hypothetical protein